jgi:hypothetical protein
LFTAHALLFASLLVVAWGIVLLVAAVVHYEVLATRLHPRRPDLRLPTDARLRKRLADIERAQATNVTVYSGYAPFAGSGVDIGAWSFGVDLEKGKPELEGRRTPKPVDLAVLRERVLTAVLATGIPGLSIRDVLHVDGDKADTVPVQPHGGHTRPVGYVDPALVATYADTDSPACRHYHRIQITTWGGEMVLSAFLRFRILRGRLYAEANYCFLPPVDHSWHKVDRLRTTPAVEQAARLAGRAVLEAPGALIGAVPRLLAEAWRVWVKQPLEEWVTKAAFRDGVVVDYGTLLTVRERGASGAYWRHFQKLDREMYVKLLEPAIFDTVVAVLDESDVDTSDLVERQNTILNQGILMTGGSLRAESLAVGREARVGGGGRDAGAVGRVRRVVAETRKGAA